MKNYKNKFKFLNILICLSILAIFILYFFIIKDFKKVKNIDSENKIHFNKKISKNKIPININNWNIEPWMTFDYVNKIFNLPTEYLKDNLNIENSRYPKISIRSYIKNKNIDENLYMSEIKNTINNFILLK